MEAASLPLPRPLSLLPPQLQQQQLAVWPLHQKALPLPLPLPLPLLVKARVQQYLPPQWLV